MALIVRCVRGYMCHATIDRNVKHVVLPAHTNRLRETNAIVIFLQILVVSFQLCLLHFRTLREHISPRTHHIYCWIFKSDLCIFIGFDSTLDKFNVRMTCISANDQFLLENTPLSYLATSSPTGVPELSLMFFTYDPDTHIIAFNTPKGRKVNNIMANDRVAMLFHNFEGKAATNSLFAGVKAQSFTLYGSASVMNGGAKKASDGDYDKAFKGGNKVKVTLHVDEVLVVNQSGHAFRFNRNECPEGRKY